MAKSSLPKAADKALKAFMASTEAVLASVDKEEVAQTVFDEGSDYQTILLDRVLAHADGEAALRAFALEFAMDPFEFENADEYGSLAARTWREAMEEYSDAVLKDPAQRGTFKERWENRFSEAVLNDRVEFLDSGAVLEEQDSNLYGFLYRPLGEYLSGLTDTYITPEEIKEVMATHIGRAIEQESGANPLQLLSRCREAVEFCFTPAWGVGDDGRMHYLDDVTTSYQGNTNCVQNAVWDKEMAKVFSFFNISPEAFLEHLRTPGQYSFMSVSLLSAEDVNEIVDDLSAGMQGEFLEAVVHDPARAALCSPAQLCEILDNASYGGVLCVAGKIAICDLYAWDEMRPASLTNSHRGSLQIGIHGFANGSGYMESFTDVNVPLPVGSLLQCRLTGRESYPHGERPRYYGIQSTYDLTGWGISLEQASPAPEKQPETESVGPSL